MSTTPERTTTIRWSVVVPAYNCAHFLPETLGEVVTQLGDREDAEIIVVDDASTDDPEAVVRAVGRGRVRYERNPHNLGAIGTFNRCVELAQGELVHLLHGDDIVLAGFYRAMEAAFGAGASPLSAMCRTVDIDDAGARLHESRRYRTGTGVWDGAFDAFVVSNRVRTPGIVVRRSAYQDVGGFRADLPHAADWEMWTRLAAAGPVVFVDEILAGYRKHGESDSSHRMRTGLNIRERVTAIGMIGRHVPPARRSATTRRALLYSVAYAGRSSWQQARQQQWRVAAVQAREGVRCLLQLPRAVAHTTGAQER
ncbi:MAG TPA: glycosyltransferase [Flexivirga sp.]|uniref:glycosyltransferase family 2 protein n=1 Tax=Flexivirga sp. TaxID=1962927 RepID=UPI002C3C8910|nr:glycosyltransferase [Flexivirga sp.]HWC21631.1 glycosyltransferase [Flexivirga sp.]